MINELDESAKEELKRADHSIYVSLKYTRTVDIIKNTIKRLLSAFDFSIIQALEFAKEHKKIPTLPPSSRQRADMVSRLYPNTKKSIDFYHRLKAIDRADFQRKEEYRKNVALIVTIAGRKTEVNMELLRDYFDLTVVFVNTMSKMTSQKKFTEAVKMVVPQPAKKAKKTSKKATSKTADKKTAKKKGKAVEKVYKLNQSLSDKKGFKLPQY